MKKKTSYIIGLIIIVVGIAFDLLSKYLFANIFANLDEDIIVIPNFFKFTYLENTGAAFGIFGDSTIALTIVSVLFIIAFCIFDYFNHSNNIWYVIGISLIISGAIGNFIDRLFLGYVRDFISIELFPFVFNLADLFITTGVICFVIYIIINTIKETKEKRKNNDLENK